MQKQEARSLTINNILPQECLEEMKVGDKKKWKSETSSLLVMAESIGMAKVMTCKNYSNLQRLFRVTALVLQLVKIFKSRLQTKVETQKELTSQNLVVAETLWIKEIVKSLSRTLSLKFGNGSLAYSQVNMES